jgi:hypothetical protein
MSYVQIHTSLFVFLLTLISLSLQYGTLFVFFIVYLDFGFQLDINVFVEEVQHDDGSMTCGNDNWGLQEGPPTAMHGHSTNIYI